MFKDPPHRWDLCEVCMLVNYLLSENEKHIEINYDNLLHGRCCSLGVCYPLPAKSSQGLLRLTTRMLEWHSMISHILSGIWSWHGRRQDGLQTNYFISGAQSLCQDTNILHSFPGGCWKCGIAVRFFIFYFILLLLKSLICPDSKCKTCRNPAGDCSRRIRQLEPIISLHSLEPSRIC